MTPENPKDPLVDWINETWQPEAPDPEEFQHGMTQRSIVRRRRRKSAGLVLLTLVGVAGIWASISSSTPTTEMSTETTVAMPEELIEPDEFWAGALTENEDNQAIPDDYEALSGFFLADS